MTDFDIVITQPRIGYSGLTTYALQEPVPGDVFDLGSLYEGEIQHHLLVTKITKSGKIKAKTITIDHKGCEVSEENVVFKNLDDFQGWMSPRGTPGYFVTFIGNFTYGDESPRVQKLQSKGMA